MKNRVALGTGASRGIGAAIAAVLARDGAQVLMPSRAEMDLAVPESIERYVGTIEGPIDILVNNAGINFLAGIDELDSATLNATLQINLVAPLQLTRLVAERKPIWKNRQPQLDLEHRLERAPDGLCGKQVCH